MAKQENLYTVDWTQFTPESLADLFAQYKANTLASVERLTSLENPTVDDLYGEEAYKLSLEEELHFTPMFHLTSVADNPEFREAYDKLIPEFTELDLFVSQHEGLYQVYKKIAEAPEAANYSVEQKRDLELVLLRYKLSGIDLDAEGKKEYARISQELVQATTKFSHNNLDSRQAWKKVITDEKELDGVPASALELYKQYAKENGVEEGYLLTLDPPAVEPITNYCKNRELRKEIWEALASIATDHDSAGGKYDNTDLVNEIYRLKTEKAKLLGFANHAELSLATKMAESPKQVLDFLNDLVDKSLDKARVDFNLLKEFAKEKDGIEDYQPWDRNYYKTLYGIEKFDINPEEVRQYLPEDQVRQGLFTVLERLYNIKFVHDPEVKCYHPDVKFFRVYEDGKLVSGIYMDIYARKGKRSGAWMNICFGRSETKTQVKLPVAYIVCNFNPPVNGKAACLTHYEVVTLFHEMGHALHLLLTKTEVESLCGTNVEWDAVELPSQIHENWCYEKEGLSLLTRHAETGETMPDDLVDRLVAYRQFTTNAEFLCRQLEFGIFDMELYSKGDDDKRTAKEVYSDVVARISKEISPTMRQMPDFPNTFSHIFAGGYSAGYYSYLWADILASDAFEAYKEEGDIFSPKVAKAFKDHVLAVGGTYPFMQSYENFRGRKPAPEPLLKSYGLIK